MFKSKKLLVAAAVALAGSASALAASPLPVYFSEDFTEMSKESDDISGGWTCRGINAVPKGEMQGFFGNTSDAPAYKLLDVGADTYAISCCNFENGETGDQWLISPEIEVPVDQAVLIFDTFVYSRGNEEFPWGTSRFYYKVFVSETGTAAEDFNQETPVTSGNVRPNNAKEFTTSSVYVPLNGFKGKKIHLAFVNQSANQGPCGFSNIRIQNYFVSFDNQTPEICKKGENPTFSVNVGLNTPVSCTAYKAVLAIDGKEIATKVVERKGGFSGTRTNYAKVDFENAAAVENFATYTITVTPEFEGAIPAVCYGAIGVPSTAYLNNVVVEELTATGCPYCPRGAAALEYYGRQYPGKSDEGKFIGIAIHDAMGGDPMNNGVASYERAIMQINGSTNLPQAVFNRVTRGSQAEDYNLFLKELRKTSYVKAAITDVRFPELSNPDDIFGSTIEVQYNVRSAYNATQRDLRAAVVMIENDVKGYNSSYNQDNIYYSWTTGQVRESFGSWLVDDMTKYCIGGELAQNPIKYDKYVFQHVARGIWPSITGEDLEGAWEADVDRAFKIQCKVPENLMKFENTEMIVLVFNDKGDIVASDILPYSQYRVWTGVDGVESDSKCNVIREGQSLKVVANAGAAVNVYGVDGTLLGNYTVADAPLSIDASAFQGVVIVKVEGNSAFKFLF